jgi:hypothetical protein
MLGLIVLAGGILDALSTVFLSRAMASKYAELQLHDFQCQRAQTQIFGDLAKIFAAGDQERTVRGYHARYADLTSFGIATALRFLSFNLGRSLVVNMTNLCTWVDLSDEHDRLGARHPETMARDDSSDPSIFNEIDSLPHTSSYGTVHLCFRHVYALSVESSWA